MSDDELSKITPFVKSAQAIRHEKYDFGSYSKLASEIVGWKTISQYDELLFVNDSCYSLKSLSSVFEKMEQSNCDFWGIQLTKGMGISEKPTTPTDYDVNDFLTANQINEEVEELDQNPFWDLHVGSYFIAFRSNVFMDSDFQLAVESVTKESDKANIVIKYEMGWTHLLLKKGYHVDSFISKIYPFHPLFTEWYFKLLDEGMPLLKRFLLSENHYYLPNLYLWKNRIAPYTSNEVITEIQNNLSRTTDPKKLNYLHHIKN